jgi:hypothetical protein
MQALSLAKECYSMKLDLLTNATVVDDVIRFVSDRSKEKLKSSCSNGNEDHKEESEEPDHGEDVSCCKSDGLLSSLYNFNSYYYGKTKFDNIFI